MPRKSLTTSAIEALRPNPQRYDVADARERGLTLRVYPTGEKVFRYRMRSLAKVVTIGPYSSSSKPAHVTLSQARARVEQLREARRAGGVELVETQERIAAELRPQPLPMANGKTVGEVAVEWWKVLDKQRKRGRREAEPVFKKHIDPVIGHLPLVAVKRSHCAEIVERATNTAPVHAAKVLALVKQLLDFGARRFADDDFSNPALSLKAKDFGVRNTKRKRWLNEEEIVAFWQALEPTDGAPETEADRGKMAAALRLLLVTGLRSGELRLARWQHYDSRALTLTIPVAHQKLTPAQAEDATDFVVPLPQLAASLFEQLKRFAGRSPHVLASASATAGVYSEKSIGRFMRRLWKGEPSSGAVPHPTLKKFPPASPHDLRRTMRTWLGKLGVAPHIAERSLNHRLGRIVETYDQNDYLPERRLALERWAAELARLIAAH
jgi:integrase